VKGQKPESLIPQRIWEQTSKTPAVDIERLGDACCIGVDIPMSAAGNTCEAANLNRG
jgi:hypothetical protein